jgi:glycosyltransferase involved in cell wall biosynthesis
LLSDKDGQKIPSVTLVAIAKNESFYLTEWIAYHLLIGFEKIYIFDNDSTDQTLELLSSLSKIDTRVSYFEWPSQEGLSPQISAYNYALKYITTDWVAFIDIDEFLVPWQYNSISEFLTKVPNDISAVHINWRGFGSNQIISPDYSSIIETFTACSEQFWGNNYHYKTIVRTDAADKVFIHYADVKYGRRALSDFSDVKSESHGIAENVVYNGIQINHYQSKTYSEFQRRMNNGSAYHSSNHPGKFRESSYRRFLELDQNKETNDKISSYLKSTKLAHTVIEQNLPEHLRSGSLKSEWIKQLLVSQEGQENVLGGPGRLYFFLTFHGTLLSSHKNTRELCQRRLSDDAENHHPLSIRSNLPIADISGLRLQNYLAEKIKLPGNLVLADVFFASGKLPNTVSLKYRENYITAQKSGEINSRAKKCLEWECFYLITQEQLDLLYQN